VQADIHKRGIDHQDWRVPGSKALYPGKEDPRFMARNAENLQGNPGFGE